MLDFSLSESHCNIDKLDVLAECVGQSKENKSKTQSGSFILIEVLKYKSLHGEPTSENGLACAKIWLDRKARHFRHVPGTTYLSQPFQLYLVDLRL